MTSTKPSAARRALPRLWSTLRYLMTPKASRAGIAIIAAIALMIVAGSAVAGSPYATSAAINSPPSLAHIFGTDYLGRDVFSQVVHGAYVSLFVAIVASIASVLLGSVIGMFAGYYSKAEAPLSGLGDVLMAFPTLPFLILLGLLFSPTNLLIAVLLAIVLWPAVSRSIRAQVASIKRRPYVDAARVGGYSDMRIIFSIISPEITPISMAYFVINTSSAIVIVTALEFLGVGNVNVVTWGSILYWAQQYAFFSGDWWWVLAPGLVISLLAIGLALVGYAVEEITNPRLRSVRLATTH